MISTNISNINNLSIAYNSVEDTIGNSIRGLRSEFNEFTEGNVYYKKYNIKKIVLSIVIDLVLLAIVVEYKKIGELILGNGSDFLSGRLEFLLLFVLSVGLAYGVYTTGVMIYCRVLEGYVSRIDKIEKQSMEALGMLKAEELNNQLISAATKNEDYSIVTNNFIGNKIAKIRDGFLNTNRKAYNVRRAVNIGTSAALFAFLLLYMLLSINSNIEVASSSGMTITLLYVMAIALIGIAQCNAGEYMGRYTKVIGCAMAFIYGGTLAFCIKDMSFPAFEIKMSETVSKFNIGYLVIVTIQVIGMILAVCLSHYGLEKDKWDNGFQVAMSYGSKDNGNKITLLIRGGLATVLAFTLCGEVSNSEVTGFFAIVLTAVLWYSANCILKPRGSYLYTFWGKGRSIANEVIMVAMVLSAIICGRGTISSEEMVCLGISFAVSFVVAGIAKSINNFA